jgi:CheY-like chemotaxis protein
MTPPRILVVDDQAINVQLLRLKLEREGMQVLTAPSGREALAQAATARPDLILMDLLMPDMDGLTACRQLKADPATRDIPVIFLTASPSKEHRQEGRAAGAADYLVKPIDLDETMARASSAKRRNSPPASTRPAGARWSAPPPRASPTT